MNGIESFKNRTTTVLSAAQTFTGEGEKNDYPDVMVNCYADAPGTLYFDFSTDNTNWRTFPLSGFQVAAGVNEIHTAVKGSRYFRVRFVNGTSNQTEFQLLTSYGTYRALNSPLNQSYGLDADSILVRPSLPWLDVARGLITGMEVVKKFGRNLAVSAGFSPVAIGGLFRTPQASGATTLRIKAGGNANDDVAGSGAREITLEGLDENFNTVTEVLVTAGASASAATTALFTRLNRLYVSKSGTYATSAAGSHAADIVIENSAGTQDWAVIDSTDFPKGQSEIGCYSVPDGYTAYVVLVEVTVDSGANVTPAFFHRGSADQSVAPYDAMRIKSLPVGVDGGVIGAFGKSEVPFGPFVGPCDLGFMAKGAATPEVSVEFDVYLVNE